MPNSSYFPKRNGFLPRYIIIHGTAGGTSAAAIATYFQNEQGGPTSSSAHYIIGVEGEIIQTVLEGDGAWSNGLLSTGHDTFWQESINPNLLTISIEHCKPSTNNSDELSPAQKASSFELVRWICSTWKIPMRWADANGGITGHYSIDPINRWNCPGPYPWDELFSYLNGGGDVATVLTLDQAGSFVDKANSNDTTWKFKNGFLVGHGILSFYRTVGQTGLNGLTLLGLPTSNEHGVPGKPGIVEQNFERVYAVRYDPNHAIENPPGSGPVYVAHAPEYSALQASVASLTAQLEACKAEKP